MNQKEIRQIERLFVEWDDHNDKFIAGAIFKDGTQTRTDYDGVGPTVTHDTARELADAVVALAWHHGHNIDSNAISVTTTVTSTLNGFHRTARRAHAPL